ncbi:MAG: sigma-70 family RNA polymerase sigma factor [Verrucomicrobiota bacterium]
MSYRLATIETAPTSGGTETTETAIMARGERPAPPAPPSPSPHAVLAATVRRAQSGDLEAQADLVRRYHRRIMGLVRGIVSPRCVVEDLVQTTMIKMLRRLPQLRNPEVFESWMLSLARNGALDYLRRRKCQPVMVFDEVALNTAPEAPAARTEAEIMAALERALMYLNSMDRRLVQLVVQGNSYQAIANRVGVTVATVKIRLHRVRPFLRARVGAEIGVEASAAKSLHPPE